MRRILLSTFLLIILSTVFFTGTASAHEQHSVSSACGYTVVRSFNESGFTIKLWENGCNQALYTETINTGGSPYTEAYISYLGQSSAIYGSGYSVTSGIVYLADQPGSVTYCGGDANHFVWGCGTL